jgi:D-alanyl-D-alanine carboxypeptidase (penicillin-binding protein 5/6)
VNNKPPKYVLLVFLAILAMTGFGIGQQLYKPKLDTANINALAIDAQNLGVSPIPKIIDGSQEPKTKAKNIILIDADSKHLMYGLGARDKVQIASITKVMTALVAYEQKNLDEVVTIEAGDCNVIGSKIGIKAGDRIKTGELLKALLIKSGNDTAKALARTSAGNEEEFVRLMNEKALSIGLNDTRYMDPHGLSAEAYSTPFDQAILFSYVLKIDKLKEIMSTDKTTIVNEDGIEYELENSNRLITDKLKYEGAIAGKTGFTFEAGHSLVAAANRNGHTLISVVLNTFSNTNEASAQETAKLLDWGFDNFIWE